MLRGRVRRVGVLFVCANNICRSPMAAAVFQATAARAGLSRLLRVSSAGTRREFVGHDVDPRARAAAQNRGYRIASHAARQITARDFDRFDWIVAMDRSILASLAALSPSHFTGKLVLCREFATNEGIDDIPDPYFGAAQGFEHILDLLQAPAQGLVDVIARTMPLRPAR